MAEPAVAENGTPVLFVRTQGGRVIHAWDCPTLKTAKEPLPWKYAANKGWDYDTILDEDVLFRLCRQMGLRFCRRCLSWHADASGVPVGSQERDV